VYDEILVIFAGTRGYLDRVPVGRVQEWEKKFLTFIRDQKPEIRKSIENEKDLSDNIIQQIDSAIKEFNAQHDFIRIEDEAGVLV
jgi:F-type H+-transporting ATPase subunit alpha